MQLYRATTEPPMNWLRSLFGHNPRPPLQKKPPAWRRARPAPEALEDRLAPAITFEFRTDYDVDGFFRDRTPPSVNPNTPWNVLHQAARDLGDRLTDTLTAIPRPPAGS